MHTYTCTSREREREKWRSLEHVPSFKRLTSACWIKAVLQRTWSEMQNTIDLKRNLIHSLITGRAETSPITQSLCSLINRTSVRARALSIAQRLWYVRSAWSLALCKCLWHFRWQSHRVLRKQIRHAYLLALSPIWHQPESGRELPSFTGLAFSLFANAHSWFLSRQVDLWISTLSEFVSDISLLVLGLGLIKGSYS